MSSLRVTSVAIAAIIAFYLIFQIIKSGATVKSNQHLIPLSSISAKYQDENQGSNLKETNALSQPPISSSSKPVENQEQNMATTLSLNLKRYPFLKTNIALSQKVLLSDEDQHLWHTILGNVTYIRESASFLTNRAYTDELYILTHIQHLNYLAKALEWVDNPAEDDIIAQIIDTVLHFPDDYDQFHESQMRILIGNKIELISLIRRYHPTIFDQTFSHHPKLTKIIKYMNQYPIHWAQWN